MFAFRARSGALDWNKIESLDIDAIIVNSELGSLQSLVDMVTFSHIQAIDVKKGSDSALLNYIRLSQLMLEYLLVGQEQQGTTIEKIHFKNTALKRKCSKLETANIRLHEDVSVYQSELQLMHKLHASSAMGGALVVSESKSRAVLPPKITRVAGTNDDPKTEARVTKQKQQQKSARAPDDSDSSNETRAEEEGETKATYAEDLSHSEIDLRLHIARLFEIQRELIEENVVKKEDAVLLQVTEAENMSKERDSYIQNLSDRVDILSKYMEQLLESVAGSTGDVVEGEIAPKSTSSAGGAIANSTTASPFRKKPRGTPDTSCLDLDGSDVTSASAAAQEFSVEPFTVEGGDSLVEEALSHINRPLVSSRSAHPKRNAAIGNMLQKAAEEVHEESVQHEQARQRNHALTRREAEIAAREQELINRESRIRLMEQAVKSSATKLDKQRDELEVGKLRAALFKDAQQTPERRKDGRSEELTTCSTSMSTSTELEWVLSPSPEKVTHIPVKVSSKENLDALEKAVSVEVEIVKPPPKPRKSATTTSMATSTSGLETLKAQEQANKDKEAKKAEMQRQRDLGAKIIRTCVGHHQKLVINRRFRKWLDHTVEGREAENYHIQFEAEKKAEIASALLAREREKEKIKSRQLKAEREELRRKDEEMHSRLAAERDLEKERYAALVAEGEKEKIDRLEMLERLAVDNDSASLLTAAQEATQQTEALLQADWFEQKRRESVQKKAEEDADNENKSLETDSSSIVSAKPIKPGRASLKPDKPTKPPVSVKSTEDLVGVSVAKPSKQVKNVPAAVAVQADSSNENGTITTPVRNTPVIAEELFLKSGIEFECVFEHGAHIRDSPSRNARNIGEIDKGDISEGTGRVQIDGQAGGLMYVELKPSPERPTGGWVPVRTKGGQAVVKENGPVAKVLRYKCVFEHGAFVRNIPSRNANNVGEIDEGEIAIATGKVETEEGENGVVFIELQISPALPHGGWVPLVSKAGHTVFEPYLGTPEKVVNAVNPAESGGVVVDAQSVDDFLLGLEDVDNSTDLFELAQSRIAQASGSGKK